MSKLAKKYDKRQNWGAENQKYDSDDFFFDLVTLKTTPNGLHIFFLRRVIHSLPSDGI